MYKTLCWVHSMNDLISSVFKAPCDLAPAYISASYSAIPQLPLGDLQFLNSGLYVFVHTALSAYEKGGFFTYSSTCLRDIKLHSAFHYK